MDGHGPGIIPCENETQCQVSRKSKEGKTLTYKLHIIQQPLQARACGSGQKSSADRRPVDPPPIVEMRIFEGDNEAEQKDITFAMNGNYLLFAELEHARKLAPVRGQPDQKGPPVLTGTPVAGMVYLERPNRAGYFIFPDLSVRHEGKYRIVFSLFEEVKDAKDEDCIADHEKPIGWRNGYISHRVQIRSQPFNVYSAKKFPGLAESTPLSRMVADQGCRVRIRRDVRMRRRDTKPGKDWDGYDDEGGKMRGRMSATPDSAYHHAFGYPRPRSGSNASHRSIVSAVSRRPSMEEIAYQQATYGAAPPAPQNPYPESPSLGPPSTQTQYTQSPAMHAHPSMHALPPAYPASHLQQPAQHAARPAYPNYHSYGSAPPPPPQAAPPMYDAQPLPHRFSNGYSSPQIPVDTRRTYSHSLPSDSGPPPQHTGYNHASTYPPPSYHTQHTHQSSLSSLDGYAKPEPLQPPTRTTGAHTPLSSRPFDDKLPPINTAWKMPASRPLEPASPPSALPQPSGYGYSAAADPHKRSYGSVFSDRHLREPLRQGARPSVSLASYNVLAPTSLHTSPTGGSPEQDFENDIPHNSIQMNYRRADGREVNRYLPQLD